MKYFIIAGEASGDLHASKLIDAIGIQDSEAEFQFWGGDKMQKSAKKPPLKHYRNLAFMGFIEVVQNLKTILQNLKLAKKQIQEYQPDVVILVDYPGFNLKIAKFTHQLGIKVFYYISPKVWAWKQKRVFTIKENVDHMFTILPFETAFYKQFNIDVDYIGNPLMDTIEGFEYDSEGEALKEIGQPIIALLPGSREQELRRILPTMLEMIPEFPNYQFILAATDSLSSELYSELIGKASPVKIIYNQTYNILRSAEAALVTSGTATLETALFNVPQVVCYKANNVSYAIAKKLVKIKFISLVNLILNREAVKELIQEDLNKKTLQRELSKILIDGSKREDVISDYTELKSLVGNSGASHRAAKLMFEYLHEE